jgi:hypothetical protein
MTGNFNVIILESQNGFSERIREYLQSQGQSTHVASNLKDVTKVLKHLVTPVILAELPNDTKAANKYINECLKIPNLLDYPFIAVGLNTDKYKDRLSKFFKFASCQDKPVNHGEIMKALSFISENFIFPGMQQPCTAAQSSGRTSDLLSTSYEPPKSRTETVILQQESLSVSELYSGFDSVPNLFFNQLDKYNLLNKDFNGKKYVLFMTENSIGEGGYLTHEFNTLDVYKEISSVPKFIQIKLHRVAYLSHQIIKNLVIDNSIIDDAKEAAILFNWSLVNEQKVYFKKDYLSLKSKVFRKELCSKIKDSAMNCALKLSKVQVAEIISLIGKYIGQEEAISDKPLSLAASAIAAVDMIDRACWQSNHFNPRAAYKIMLMAKTGELADIHPAVICSLIKVLSEALATNIKLILVPKNLRSNEALLKAASELVANDGETKVEINQLAPGMKLSRPLIAFDGKEILEQDMILDQDLIWRIWQLSMVRALNAPLIVDQKTLLN